jgi:hypothetical protein
MVRTPIRYDREGTTTTTENPKRFRARIGPQLPTRRHKLDAGQRSDAGEIRHAGHEVDIVIGPRIHRGFVIVLHILVICVILSSSQVEALVKVVEAHALGSQ